MAALVNRIKNYFSHDGGATSVEYVLIASAMALALVASMPFISTAVSAKYKVVADDLNNMN